MILDSIHSLSVAWTIEKKSFYENQEIRYNTSSQGRVSRGVRKGQRSADPAQDRPSGVGKVVAHAGMGVAALL